MGRYVGWVFMYIYEKGVRVYSGVVGRYVYVRMCVAHKAIVGV